LFGIKIQSLAPNPQSLDIILLLEGTNHRAEYGANRLRIQYYGMFFGTHCVSSISADKL